MKIAVGLGLAFALCACATTPPAPPPPTTLSDAEFRPLMSAAFRSDKRIEWEPPAAALLARTDLTDAQRADIYFMRRIKRGVFVETRTVATPQCAVMDIDRGLALQPTGPSAEAAQRDRLYQLSRHRYFEAPGNCD
ncbi:MAG: hypothetical protein ABMA14_25055 [Hyphomonadaceae bacterium]